MCLIDNVVNMNSSNTGEEYLLDGQGLQKSLDDKEGDPLEPQIGMCPSSQDAAAYIFYNRYAKAHGGLVLEGEINGILYRTICCSNEGQKWTKGIGPSSPSSY